MSFDPIGKMHCFLWSADIGLFYKFTLFHQHKRNPSNLFGPSICCLFSAVIKFFMLSELALCCESFSAFPTFEAVDIDVMVEIVISKVAVVFEFCSAF